MSERRRTRWRTKPADGDALAPYPPALRHHDGRKVVLLPVPLDGQRSGAVVVLEHPGTKEIHLVLETPADMRID